MTDELQKRSVVDRLRAVRHLSAAIAACEPEDAAVLMTAALDGMLQGSPVPSLFELEDQAHLWATSASPAELEAYLSACIERLTMAASHVPLRKRMFMLLWQSFTPKDREAFITCHSAGAEGDRSPRPARRASP
ncbi:hypothetical protein CESP606_18400 [Cereibacter sphaeroides]|nr:hypothetical protein [Cereibacter sphaeroides]AMJ49753.1 hypothetical protein APX01_19510 [Cereibacter sphaeroides]ANS36515.1 hypothetical protein A3858_19795 [Cereibacter sphaeroides]ATN65527.1 hypothetical protein A3857_19540 [Cereibacter sphaeroides]GEM95410.1 hypothetical protein RSP03_44770 [Cereibacter sphaeroides]